jgi:hypothetical protein
MRVMPFAENRSKYKAWRWLAFWACLYVISGLVLQRVRVNREPARKAANRIRIQNVSSAIRQFQATYDRWPANLIELRTNNRAIIFFEGPLKDVYGNPYIYDCPQGRAIGRIGSFGADGRAGGTKADEDFFIELK